MYSTARNIGISMILNIVSLFAVFTVPPPSHLFYQIKGRAKNFIGLLRILPEIGEILLAAFLVKQLT